MPWYCKLPGYHHPVLINDCQNASIYFLKNLESFGVDPSQVVLCGESIGSWAVAIVTQALTCIPSLPHINAQILICPLVNFINFQLPSHQQNKNVPLLTRDFMFMCMCKYLVIDLCWKDAMLTGSAIPLDKWKKYRKWLSYDNMLRNGLAKDVEQVFISAFTP
ncbi:arylacetamide deacetylase-like 4-like protein [Cricetulus griseus]|uniref:Arylacetamide deacetylase-like 4-like protein n=1 Tax=Cricetulus griseus TaxID=10029 RepID=A0A061IDV2_CRIGR|nr:arylacetamide deacetylase-like 4-like protein [Cricetulus griseus]